MVGRWPSGAPLALAPEGDRSELGEENDFGYFAEDRHGLRCPIGAHARRSYPRDSLDPNPGSPQSIEVGNRHRLLRRGRQYGPFFSREELLSGALGRRAALASLHLSGRLPLASARVRSAQLAQQPPLRWAVRQPPSAAEPGAAGGPDVHGAREAVRRRYSGLPRFVSVRGGAYFFLPGIRALRYLASLNGSEAAGSA